MFTLETEWWEIVVRTSVVYVVLLAGLRLTGKRQIGQMAPFDLVVILLISEAVQNAMMGPDTSLLGGLISAGVLLGASAIMAYLRDRVPGLRTVLEGQPALLVADGKIVTETLRRQGVDTLELEQAIREQGVDGLSNVKMAVLEVDGTISVVPKDTPTIRTERSLRDRNRRD